MSTVILAWFVALVLQAPAAPSSNWAQFRNTPPLSGVAATTLPATLKVLWTYDAGGAIESSAAIVDGVVYVGSASGELHAVDFASGKVQIVHRFDAPVMWGLAASPDGRSVLYTRMDHSGSDLKILENFR